MTQGIHQHVRIEFFRPAPLERVYAHHFRFGDAAREAPVLLYVTGFKTDPEYRSLYARAPEEVADAVGASLRRTRPMPLHLLVCPAYKLAPGESDRQGDAFVQHWDGELLPALGLAPTAVAAAGMSEGAGLAVALLGALEEARALVTFGGVDLLQAARAAEPWVPRGLPALLLWNWDDPLRPRNWPPDAVAANRLVAGLRAIGIAATIPKGGGGGHSFADHVANGTAAVGFDFALQHLGAK